MSAWRENIEQIRETLISLANTPSKYGAREDALARLAALTAQMEELEAALRRIANIGEPVAGTGISPQAQRIARAALAQSDPPEN